VVYTNGRTGKQRASGQATVNLEAESEKLTEENNEMDEEISKKVDPSKTRVGLDKSQSPLPRLGQADRKSAYVCGSSCSSVGECPGTKRLDRQDAEIRLAVRFGQ